MQLPGSEWRDLPLQLPQVKMSLCFREANSCVDALAKLGASISDGNTRFVTPPPEVIPLLQFEFLGMYGNRLCPTACGTTLVNL
uniref:Uncharacterized protein n=1 Tax=Quercus lobata TaxID=97700 RepID=A0A7N2M2I5_QUELO